MAGFWNHSSVKCALNHFLIVLICGPTCSYILVYVHIAVICAPRHLLVGESYFGMKRYTLVNAHSGAAFAISGFPVETNWHVMKRSMPNNAITLVNFAPRHFFVVMNLLDMPCATQESVLGAVLFATSRSSQKLNLIVTPKHMPILSHISVTCAPWRFAARISWQDTARLTATTRSVCTVCVLFLAARMKDLPQNLVKRTSQMWSSWPVQTLRQAPHTEKKMKGLEGRKILMHPYLVLVRILRYCSFLYLANSHWKKLLWNLSWPRLSGMKKIEMFSCSCFCWSWPSCCHFECRYFLF